MNRNKLYNIIYGTVVILFIAVIGYFGILGILSSIDNSNNGLKGIDSVRDTISIVGIGTSYNGGISGTVAPTIFQFASSSDETYWDSTLIGFPHLYGATTTVYLENRSADRISFNGVYKGITAASSFVFEISGSNDSDCGQTMSNSADWYPVNATTTENTAILIDEDNTFTINPADTASTTFAFTIKDVNYNCTRLKFYTNSTTDASLLYVEATLKEN